jgi:hypothetical protein
LAHRDWNTALNVAAHPLPSLTIEKIDDALSEIEAFLNSVDQLFDGTETAFEAVSLVADGNALSAWLKRGVAFEELESAQKIDWNYLRQSEYGAA